MPSIHVPGYYFEGEGVNNYLDILLLFIIFKNCCIVNTYIRLIKEQKKFRGVSGLHEPLYGYVPGVQYATALLEI